MREKLSHTSLRMILRKYVSNRLRVKIMKAMKIHPYASNLFLEKLKS